MRKHHQLAGAGLLVSQEVVLLLDRRRLRLVATPLADDEHFPATQDQVLTLLEGCPDRSPQAARDWLIREGGAKLLGNSPGAVPKVAPINSSYQCHPYGLGFVDTYGELGYLPREVGTTGVILSGRQADASERYSW